eukprot:scaffold479_cov119-Isochrysis_galbana.AAC.3
MCALGTHAPPLLLSALQSLAATRTAQAHGLQPACSMPTCQPPVGTAVTAMFRPGQADSTEHSLGTADRSLSLSLLGAQLGVELVGLLL